MRKKILSFLLLLTGLYRINHCSASSFNAIILPGTISDTAAPLYYRLNGTYLESYWSSFKKVVTSPARWNGMDWRNFGIITGSGILLSLADVEIRDFVQRNKSPFSTSVSDFFEPFGNRYPPFILTSLYLAAVVTKDRKLEHATLMSVKSLLLSTFFYTLTKATIRRQRPLRATGQYEFATPFSKNNFTSFPSGHSNTAFTIATAMAMEYKNKKWVGILSYSLAALTALSRVHENRHWVSDLIFGISIGHFVTKAIYARDKKKNTKLLELPHMK